MCRAVFEIPADINAQQQGKPLAAAASSLPVNHFVSTMLAASSPLGKSLADPNNLVCEICDENQASEYCKDCPQAFCATCKKLHLKTKATVAHQFISLDEAMKPGSGGSVPRITRCEKHPQLEINSYCRTDKRAICAECVVDSHVGHQVERLTNVVQGFKEEISQLVGKVPSFSFPSPPCDFLYLDVIWALK